MLPRFKVFVACDIENGFSKKGTIPWNLAADRKFLKEKTVGNGNNVIIMGKDTFLAMPHKPLPLRKNVIISGTMNAHQYQDVLVYPSLLTALTELGKLEKTIDNVFIWGGQQLYTESLTTFGYLCDKVYLTRVKGKYSCDRHFPYHILETKPSKIKVDTSEYTILSYKPQIRHQEEKYLTLTRKILHEGEKLMDRTNVGTLSKFGKRLKFDISNTIPILTTKKTLHEKVIKELLWMISGSTSSKVLEEQNVMIWKANSTREFLDGRGLPEYEEGDLGPIYGFQWRYWNAEYLGTNEKYTGQGIDQLLNVINLIKTQPQSRRLLVSAWNVEQLDKMALPPCHVMFQFHVSQTGHLDCQVYQRSADVFLGLPFNIVFYSVLTYIIGHLTHFKPRKLIMCLGDAHVYSTHIESAQKMLQRTPLPWATLSINKEHTKLEDFTFDSFEVHNYISWPYISAPMSV